MSESQIIYFPCAKTINKSNECSYGESCKFCNGTIAETENSRSLSDPQIVTLPMKAVRGLDLVKFIACISSVDPNFGFLNLAAIVDPTTIDYNNLDNLDEFYYINIFFNKDKSEDILRVITSNFEVSAEGVLHNKIKRE